ncbi:TetR/AcrR family transcriptional regulator [Nonomuraea sp. NN258]|uniref:TetR/AcrR family transcriptional regulator n=1 Tax=Nonomuraea antri TaxID=2730852 RepID=UPI0015686ABA|nr:TetR/AcrR family transcriptional regulator [Nonomuraea antri]NRQ38762.1 TetR/AcrR family transcriptional regulator [Nonomuraea antri]
MPSASAERGQVTRQRLLEAAIALVGEVGWGGVTTRMVAERAGVAPGVVHYHFSSVTSLLITAGVGFGRVMLDELGTRLAERPGIDEGVDWLLGELSRYTGTDPASLLVSEMFLASTRLPELRERLEELVTRFRSQVAAWLRARGHRGDSEAAATVFAAAVDGLMMHRALDPRLDLTRLAGPLRAMLKEESTA